MAPYIFTARNGIYIIDLQKTCKKIDEAYAVLKGIIDEGKTVIFVGTKKQAQECVKEEAERCGMYYVNQRWLGCMLTNFDTIKARVEKMKKIEAMEQDGTFDLLPKKEVIEIKKEMVRLEAFFGGIKEMTELPGAIFVVDPKTEHNAVLEARKLGIPVFGLVDTNCDPDDVDYIIPANDDGVRAVRLIVGVMANAVLEGLGQAVEPYVLPEEEKQPEEQVQRPAKPARGERKPRPAKPRKAEAEAPKAE